MAVTDIGGLSCSYICEFSSISVCVCVCVFLAVFGTYEFDQYQNVLFGGD